MESESSRGKNQAVCEESGSRAARYKDSWVTFTSLWETAVASLLFVSLLARTKLGHGLLSGQYSKPPVKSELIEQVMKEEHKVCIAVCHVDM